MRDRLLELELQILILRHGRGHVLRALNSISGAATDDVERAIMLEQKKRTEPARIRGESSAKTLINKLFTNRPKGTQLAEEIVANFESRKFLPERRDAQHFLSRLQSGKPLKSRAAALEPLLRALAQMTDGELAELSKASSSPKSDDYLVLARQIMRGTSDHHKLK